MLSVKEAQNKVLEYSIKIKTVNVPILDSLGLVLAEDIISKYDIPVYDNSAMDGYEKIGLHFYFFNGRNKRFPRQPSVFIASTADQNTAISFLMKRQTRFNQTLRSQGCCHGL